MKLLSILILSCALPAAISESPHIERASPLLLVPGKAVTLTFQGKNLKSPGSLWTSFPAAITTEPLPNGEETTDSVAYKVSLLGDFPTGIGAYRLVTDDGVSALRLIPIDTLQNVLGENSNHKIPSAQILEMPVAVSANSDELQLDFYRVHLEKAQHLAVDVVAHRIGSELDPVLRLLDQQGQELAYCDDAPGIGSDARIDFIARDTGDFILEVRDIRYKGGDAYPYVLRATYTDLSPLPFLPVRESRFDHSGSPRPETTPELEPNSTPNTATSITIPTLIQGSFARDQDVDLYAFNVETGQRLRFEGRTRSLGSTCDLMMTLMTENGSVLKESDFSGANEGTLTHRFEGSDRYLLTAEELNGFGAADFKYEIQVTTAQPDFQLSLETETWVATPESDFEIKITCLRRDYDGPVTLELRSAETGLRLTDHLIAAGSQETTAHVKIPKALKPAQLISFSVFGYAKIGNSFFETQASTAPALKKLFPRMLYPIRELDGLAAVGIISASNSALKASKDILKKP